MITGAIVGTVQSMESRGAGHRTRARMTRFLRVALGGLLLLSLGTVVGPGVAAAHADDGTGLRWALVKEPDCPPRSCWQVTVTARSTSCPHGLYLSLNQWRQADVRSSSNVFISQVATVIPRLRRGQTAILTLPRSARTAESASIGEINCY